MYKLINTQTKEEHLCDKVTIDGFDYYYIDERPKMLEWFFDGLDLISSIPIYQRNNKQKSYEGCYKIICTNNPNIDIPKVVGDRLTIEVNNHFKNYWKKEDGTEMKGAEISASMMTNMLCETSAFLAGYNKSQETDSFSEEDMIQFAIFYQKHQGKSLEYWGKDLFKIWKEQQVKTVYYE